jgi:type II secretory pathway component PulF
MARSHALLYTQIAQMLDAGLNLPDALETILPQCPSGLRKRFQGVLQALHSGELPAQAFQENRFSPLEVAFLQVSEQTGDFPQTFKLLAQQEERRDRLKKQIQQALAYPILLLIVCPLAFSAPQLIKAGINAYLLEAFYFYLSTFGSLFVLLLLHYGLSPFQTYQGFLNHLPLLGSLRQQFALARFSGTLSGLLAAGVETRKSLNLACQASAPSSYSQKVQEKIPEVLSGVPFSEAFSEIFPPVFISLVQTGEKSGHLPESLQHLERLCLTEAEHRSSVLMKILPVFVFLGVALYLGYRIVSFWLDLYGSLGL